MNSALALLPLAAVTLSVGCARHIGDACSLSTDCSINGDRLCDTTQPGGYCTQFNCEPNLCPEDSACVRFAESTCSAPTQSSRFVRTFCIATCESDGDCRGDYRCVDLHAQPGRTVVDLDPPSWKVCIVPETATVSAPAAEPAICRPPPSTSGAVDSGTADGASGADVATGADGASEDGTAEASSADALSVDGSGPADVAVPEPDAEAAVEASTDAAAD